MNTCTDNRNFLKIKWIDALKIIKFLNSMDTYIENYNFFLELEGYVH
jgi:hypothetical protein